MKLLLMLSFFSIMNHQLCAIEFIVTKKGLLIENEKIKSEIELSKKKIEDSESKKEVEKLSIRELEKTKVRYDNLIKNVLASQEQLEKDKEQLQADILKVQKDKEQLAADNIKLEEETSDLQKSKNMYSTSLFASLGAIFIAIIGFIVSWPLRKLEMRLKELEIKEKEMLVK